MKVVFMGTPDFAAVHLSALLDAGVEVAAVYTQPDRPRGRGMESSPGPVKALAAEMGLPVYQPKSLRAAEEAERLLALRPDALAVVAYGRLLPPAILSIPPLGSVNIHASLLPRYRGAAPVQWAVLNGETVTGVTSMYMSEGLDEGDIIYQEETEIGRKESSGELMSRLGRLGSGLLVRTLNDIEAGIAARRAQEGADATFAPPLHRGLCPLDWEKTPEQLQRWVFGLIPWPVATAEFEGERLKVFDAEPIPGDTGRAPGTLLSAGAEGISFACRGGALLLTQVQAPGKKRMAAGDYLRGLRGRGAR